MKQKRNRDLFEKTENGSERNAPAQRENAFCPKALPENDSKERAERLTVGSHASGLNFKKKANGARRRPRAAVVAGGDPRQGREIGVYLRDQGAIPRLWEVVVVTSEYHVGGDACSGGR